MYGDNLLPYLSPVHPITSPLNSTFFVNFKKHKICVID